MSLLGSATPPGAREGAVAGRGAPTVLDTAQRTLDTPRKAEAKRVIPADPRIEDTTRRDSRGMQQRTSGADRNRASRAAPCGAARRAALAAVACLAVWATDAGAQDRAATDRAALEALYDATGGEGWTNRTNWKTAAALGDWHGVTTDADGRVTGLDLHRNGLAGPLPPALGALTRLVSLDLGRNGLTGPIPGALGSLVDLELLILSRNDFTGPVPPGLGNLANLELISLGSNALTGSIPDALAGLTRVRGLFLYDKHLTGPVPAWVGELTGLEALVLTYNPLTGTLPRSLMGLSRLADLDIDQTDACAPGDDEFRAWLASIDDFSGATCNGSPEAVDAIPAQALTEAGPAVGVSMEAWFSDPDGDELTYAAASSDAVVVTATVSGGTVWLAPGAAGRATVTVTASDPHGLSATQTMTVTTTASTGPRDDREVLEALYDATSGPAWTSSTNWKTDLPLESWYGVTVDDNGRVTKLALDDNGLVGPIPAALASLGRLDALDLAGNDLSGPIPAALGNLPRLEVLDLARNALAGPIPDALGRLSNLRGLALSWNDLSGPLPAWLGNRVGLQWLYLHGNALTGPIPNELGGLVDLQGLTLSWNDLSGGPVPTWLGRLTRLRWLYLAGIGLTGPIPSALENLTDLEALHLNSNELTGPAPAWLGELDALEELYLNSNELTGPAPAWLGAALDELDLSYNWGLSGPLSAELLSRVEDLDIFLSRLCVPPELRNRLTNIRFNGRLCGEDPNVTIDVAVVYTPAAREEAGGTAEIEAVIDLMVAETNQAYAASGVHHRLALVARTEVQYAEAGDSRDIIRLVNPSDGYMDEVHAMRDRTGADLVHLVFKYDDHPFAGSAIRPGAFGLTCQHCGGGTFAHELGHNLGLHHDRYTVHNSEGRARSHPAFGYVSPPGTVAGAVRSSRWRTVMAYNRQCSDVHALCSGLLRFSNPRQSYNGAPLGVPFTDGGASGPAGPADAVAVLEATGPAVARWRDRPGDANQPPAALGTLPDRSLRRHDRLDLDLSTAFTDPDGDPLRYAVSSSAPEVVTVLASGARLTLAAVGAGAATVRVTAADPGGLSVTRSFAVTVALGPNRPPAAAGALPDRTLQVGATVSLDLSAAFTDPDQDPLTFAASSSAPNVVAVSRSGARLTLTAAALGTATIRMTATDPTGQTAAQSFTVTVSRSAPFTDDPLRPGVTPIRAVHFTELRTRIDAARQGAGLAPFAWTDPVLTPGVTPVRLVHLLELRSALAAAYAAAGRPAPPWTDAAPTAGTTPIRAAHLTELRAAVMALE